MTLPGPVLDLRVRWRLGQVLLALAGVVALLAAFRPLAPGSSWWLRLAALVLLALGVIAAPLLAVLRGRSLAGVGVGRLGGEAVA